MMEVREYIGLPFDKENNCAALFVKVAREKRGLTIPLHVSDCEDPLDGEEITELINNEIKRRWLKVEKWQEGDAVLFRMPKQRLHVGMMIGEGDKFLHSWAGSLSSTPRLSDIHWRSRILGFYRYIG